jgi:hypothetical protein
VKNNRLKIGLLSIYGQIFVGNLDGNIDMLNIYINQILQIEKNCSQKYILQNSVCLSCYKYFNIFLRSEKSDLAMARTDQFLDDCFYTFVTNETF